MNAENDLANPIESPDEDYAVEGDGDDGETVEAFPEGEEALPGVGVEDEPEFYQNLAEELIPDGFLKTLAQELVDLTDADKKAHAKRVTDYKEAMARTGHSAQQQGGNISQPARVSKLVTIAAHPLAITAASGVF